MEGLAKFALWWKKSISFLCNGGALYALYSFLRFSNMLCDGRVLARWGGGEGGNRVVKLLYDPVFRVIK